MSYDDGLKLPITEYFDSKTIANIKRSVFLAKLAYRVRFLVKFLDHVGNRLKSPQRMVDNHILNAKYRPLANLIPNKPEDTGYTGDTEITGIFSYRSQLSDEQRLSTSESRVLYQTLIDILSGIFESQTDIKTVVNFGVGYAYVDSVLARRFPKVHFVGIYRSPFTKACNEVEFSDIPNLHFFADDIINHLSHNSYRDSLFFHSRTAVLLNKPILENIYRAAFAAGFELIAGCEQFGLSRETFSPFGFSLEDADSVHFRSIMFIHNYPALLLKAGFRTEKFEVFKTEHPHPDFRVAAFVARRVPGARPGT
jgi:hypothetical protein